MGARGKNLNKYIFMYQINGEQGFDFVNADESTVSDEVTLFIKDNPDISKLIIVDIKHTYKVPIELYKEKSP